MSTIMIILLFFLSIILICFMFFFSFYKKNWFKNNIKKVAAIGIALSISTVGIVVLNNPPDDPSYEWVIDGNTVYVNNSLVFASATPHTINGGDNVVFEFESKNYSGDIDFCWGFNQTIMKPSSIWLWKNYTHVYYHTEEQEDWGCINLYNVTNYTNLGIENYYNYNITLGNNNNSFLYNVTYENGASYGIYAFTTQSHIGDDYRLCGNYNHSVPVWTNQTFWDWKIWNVNYNHIKHNYSGMTDWYVTPNLNITNGIRYKCKIHIEQLKIQIGNISGKYWFVFKPSSETLSQAITNGHLYYLDPWYNANWLYRKEITVTNKRSAYQTRLVIFKNTGTFNCSNHCNANFSDLRFADTDGNLCPYWVENISATSGYFAIVWVNNTGNDTPLYCYYGYSTATSASSMSDCWDWSISWDADLTGDFTKYTGGTSSRSYVYSKPISGFTYSNGVRILSKIALTTVALTSLSTSGRLGLMTTGDDFDDSADNAAVEIDVDTDFTPQDYRYRVVTEDGGSFYGGSSTSAWAPTINRYDVYDIVGLSPSFINLSVYSINSNGSLNVFSQYTSNVLTDSLDNFAYGGSSSSTGAPTDWWAYQSANDTIRWGVSYTGRCTQVYQSKWSCIGKWFTTEPSMSFGVETTGTVTYDATIRNYGVDYFVWLGTNMTAYWVNETIVGMNESDESISLWNRTGWSTAQGLWQTYNGTRTGINWTVHTFDIIRVILDDAIGNQTVTMTANEDVNYTNTKAIILVNTTTNKGFNFSGYNRVAATTLSVINTTAIGLTAGDMVACWNRTGFKWDIWISGFGPTNYAVEQWDVIETKVSNAETWNT